MRAVGRSPYELPLHLVQIFCRHIELLLLGIGTSFNDFGATTEQPNTTSNQLSQGTDISIPPTIDDKRSEF